MIMTMIMQITAPQAQKRCCFKANTSRIVWTIVRSFKDSMGWEIIHSDLDRNTRFWFFSSRDRRRNCDGVKWNRRLNATPNWLALV